jgi:4'-phosphopantetheinyl transferase
MPGAVYLYVARLDRVDGAAARNACEAVISPEERARRDRFVFERNRREFLFAHGLVRRALSRHAPVAPREWRFVDGPHGRPEVAGPATAPLLRFNLTHADGLVACVVADAAATAAGVDVGIDAEVTDRPGPTVDLAERYFAPTEVAAIRALPPDAQRESFFRYWTLKEAYIKARGLGLTCPLDRFWFMLDGAVGARLVEIGIDPALGDRGERWRFLEQWASERHLVAVALGAGGDGALPPLIEGDAAELLGGR